VVEISHIGYLSQQVLLSEFLEGECLTIHLVPAENTLGEVIVSDQNKLTANDPFDQTISFRPTQQHVVAGAPDAEMLTFSRAYNKFQGSVAQVRPQRAFIFVVVPQIKI